MVKRGSYFRENPSIHWKNERDWSLEAFFIASCICLQGGLFGLDTDPKAVKRYTPRGNKENVDGTDVEMVWSS